MLELGNGEMSLNCDSVEQELVQVADLINAMPRLPSKDANPSTAHLKVT